MDQSILTLDAPALPDTSTLTSPLGMLNGVKPAAPLWFDSALAQTPELGFLSVSGTNIETLSWGPADAPGLVLVHGSGAHAGWWRFIAPFFAREYRVIAPSLSGMGGSGWRERYSIELYADELAAVIETMCPGRERPILLGHSFGGLPVLHCASRSTLSVKAAIIVDTVPQLFVQTLATESYRRGSPHKVYPTLEAALARFRFAPQQTCENLYIADFLARSALRKDVEGWSWRFDPFLRMHLQPHDDIARLSVPRCPVSLIWGDRSSLFQGDIPQQTLATLPPGTPAITIPDAAHHVMVDQPLAFVAAVRGLLSAWPSV